MSIWAGTIAAAGILALGATALAAPVTIAWLLTAWLSPDRLPPLIGLGIAVALPGTEARTILAVALLLLLGLAGGYLAAPLVIPVLMRAGDHTLVVGGLSSAVCGLVLLGPAGWRARLAPPAALVCGFGLALATRLAVPVFGDPDQAFAGLAVGVWIIAVAGLAGIAARRPWFNVAGRIVGSWLVAIGLLYGGAAFVMSYNTPTQTAQPPAPEVPDMGTLLPEFGKASP